jgi:SAM-dependent methyltransferase
VLESPRGELEFVRAHLPSAPARVLEVGCGGGALARILAADGHHVTAIDPEAPDGPFFRRETIEEHEGEGYDAVVAARSLHHVDDLDAVVAKIARIGRRFLLAEFSWERFDAPTAAWWDERRAVLEDPRGPTAAEWASRFDHLHSEAAMRAALARHFVERAFERTPYLSYFLRVADDDPEQVAIERGEIEPIGFRWAGDSRGP